jgi:catechol 2,3-dioxygenase-like lactoylglutathione lyase family enzyme
VNTEKIRVMQECARGSLAGELTFPEVVSRLVEVGVERYHADYCRQEIEDAMAISTSSTFRPRRSFRQVRFAMPSVHGILETALYVRDVEKAAAFYRRLFGFATLLDSERLIALDIAGRNVLLLFKEGATKEPFATSGGIIPGHGGSGVTHFAFSIASEDLADWQQRLVTEGIAIESVVSWPEGAQSIYFRDVDEHLVELITPGFWRIGGS